MQVVETVFENGDLVRMRNDPERNIGIVSGFRVISNDLEYLVLWRPDFSSYQHEFELDTADELPSVL